MQSRNHITILQGQPDLNYDVIPFPQPGQVAPELPVVPQTGHSIGTASRVPLSFTISTLSHISAFEIESMVDWVRYVNREGGKVDEREIWGLNLLRGGQAAGSSYGV